MPLPQKVVEQLGREPPKTPGWSGKLLMFSGTIFFIALSVYVGLAFGYKPYLGGEIEKINKDIEQFAQQISTQDQLKLLSFYSQLGNIKSLLSSQVLGLKVFDWTEKNIQVNTYIKDLNVNYAAGQLSFNAAAATIDDALQQVTWFQLKKDITNFGISGIAAAGNEWQYTVQLNLDKDYFKRSFGLGKNASTTK